MRPRFGLQLVNLLLGARGQNVLGLMGESGAISDGR